MNMVVEGLVVATVIILYISLEIYGMVYAFKGLKENKTKTGRRLMPWSSMATIQKAFIIGLWLTMIVFFFWMYNYSIFGPEPGEFYNLEIVLIGLGTALTIFGSLWMVRN
jgi:hypothetical protein